MICKNFSEFKLAFNSKFSLKYSNHTPLKQHQTFFTKTKRQENQRFHAFSSFPISNNSSYPTRPLLRQTICIKQQTQPQSCAFKKDCRFFSPLLPIPSLLKPLPCTNNTRHQLPQSKWTPIKAPEKLPVIF